MTAGLPIAIRPERLEDAAAIHNLLIAAFKGPMEANLVERLREGGHLVLAQVAVEGTAERWVTPFGHAMIAGLGLWLVWRGARGIWAATQGRAGADPHADDHSHPGHDVHGHDGHHAHGHHHDHAHDHHHGGPDHVHGPHCGHAHGPSLEEVAKVRTWRDGLALVAGIALRPCSGALFVLILTWQLGVALAGVVLALIGLLGSLYVRPRRVWVRARRSDGETHVEVAGLDRSGGGDLAAELHEIVGALGPGTPADRREEET